MTVLANLIPNAKALSSADKLRLIRLLADDLAADGGIAVGGSYSAWSPDRAFDAADVLLRTLAAETRP